MSSSSLPAPEGLWCLACERRPAQSSMPFMTDLVTKLTEADCGGQSYVICNVHSTLFVYPLAMADRDPIRRIDLKQTPATGSPAYITSHSYAQGCADELDLVVGLSSGEVKIVSLRAQLNAPAFTQKPVSLSSFNSDFTINSSRCVSVCWVPGTRGRAFVAAHANGGVHLYQKSSGTGSSGQAVMTISAEPGIRPPVVQLQAPDTASVAAVSVSSDGQHVAVACKDGFLRIYGAHACGLLGGFKSYYGGLLCCAWSPDGAYVAAGGEDDLVAVYGLKERCVVAFCEGHSSWVTAVAFDTWMCQPSTTTAITGTSPPNDGALGRTISNMSTGAATHEAVYRLASVGQDCQVVMWDVSVGDDALQAVGQPLSPAWRGAAGSNKGGGDFQHQQRQFVETNTTTNSNARNIVGQHQVRDTAEPVYSNGDGGGGADSSTSREGGSRFGTPNSSPRSLGWGLIAPSLNRRDMPICTALAQQRVHVEPLCDVLFTDSAMLLSSHDGCVKKWKRPVAISMDEP